MNRDNISALGMRLTVVGIFIMVGFTIYFNNPSLNQVWSVQQQQQQKDKSMVLNRVHSPEFQFEKNYTNVKNATQTEINHPVMTAGMTANHSISTIKLNTTQFQQIDKSRF